MILHTNAAELETIDGSGEWNLQSAKDVSFLFEEAAKFELGASLWNEKIMIDEDVRNSVNSSYCLNIKNRAYAG